MQHIDLLSSFGSSHDVTEFAKNLFSHLGVNGFEERESSNYVDECYFVAELSNMKIKISLSGEEDHEDVPCWTQFSSDVLSLSELTDAVSCIIQNKMLPAGLQVARMFNFGRKDERRVDCRVE